MDENLTAMELAHPGRVFFAELGGQTERVVMLDWPFRVAEKFISYNAYYLRRIALVDLPGWHRVIAPTAEGSRSSRLRGSRLRSARFKPSTAGGQESVEITLEYEGEAFKTWHTGCPEALLKCVAATLNQHGALGKKLIDLQAMQLVGSDRSLYRSR